MPPVILYQGLGVVAMLRLDVRKQHRRDVEHDACAPSALATQKCIDSATAKTLRSYRFTRFIAPALLVKPSSPAV